MGNPCNQTTEPRSPEQLHMAMFNEMWAVCYSVAAPNQQRRMEALLNELRMAYAKENANAE